MIEKLFKFNCTECEQIIYLEKEPTDIRKKFLVCPICRDFKNIKIGGTTK